MPSCVPASPRPIWVERPRTFQTRACLRELALDLLHNSSDSACVRRGTDACAMFELRIDTMKHGAERGLDTSVIWAVFDRMGGDVLRMLPLWLAGLFVFLAFWAFASGMRRVAARVARRRSQFPSAATAFARLAYLALMLLGFLVAATVAFPSMTPGRLVSVLGLGGVAIGFAFKDIFQNLLAGILLLIRQPFRVGDEIMVGAFTGAVEAIETRATFIRTYCGKRIIIPNGSIYTDTVTVITAYNLLRSEYDVGIGYSDDIGRAREVALNALQEVEGVLAEPAPDVLLWELAGSSKNLRVRWWTRPDRATVVRVWDRVLQAIAEALSAAAIDVPFPTRVVLFHDQTEATDGDRTRQREGWPAGRHPPAPRPLNRIALTDSSAASNGPKRNR